MTLDVSVGERRPRGEQLDFVHPLHGARNFVRPDVFQDLGIDPGLLSEFTVSCFVRTLARFDAAAEEAPLVRIYRGSVVALLEQEPASQVDESDEGD